MAMKREQLLHKASQAISTVASAGMLAAVLVSAPNSAQAQYAVSDTQLQASVTTALQKDVKLHGTVLTASAAQGVVTLTGNAANEDARLEAEQVVAGVSGVRSIQDNINIGNGTSSADATPPVTGVDQGIAPGTVQSAPQNASGVAPQSSTMPPVPAAELGTAASGMPPAPPADQSASQQPANQQYTPYPNGSAQPGSTQNNYPAQNGSAQSNPGQNYPGQSNPAQNYPAQGQGQYSSPYPGQYPGQYPVPGNGYPQQDGGYGPRGSARVPQLASDFGVSPQQQNASGPVSLPPGTLLTVRTMQPLSTNNLRGGEYFQVTSASDIYASGVVAVPRGSVLTGQVMEARNAGPLGGSPRLDLRLTSIQLVGVTYPVATETWSSQGPNKVGYTATNTIGGAAVGALIGAVAGGGVGAGIGAIAGGATGAVVSGATHGPRLDLPPEALLQFHLAQPLTVQPVPYEEAERLAASIPPQPVLRQRPVYVAAPYPGAYVIRPYPYAYYPYGRYPYGYYRRY